MIVRLLFGVVLALWLAILVLGHLVIATLAAAAVAGYAIWRHRARV